MVGQVLKRVGFVGWRGMVGTVLLERMKAAGDFCAINPYFFSTSKYNCAAPDIDGVEKTLVRNANALDELVAMDVIVSCHGGEYTKNTYTKLRANNWKGYWLDVASTLRLAEDSVIVLDPVNYCIIEKALEEGVRTFVGGNCTVSLMAMAICGLLQNNMVEWVNFVTYQAVSGAGAKYMAEFLQQTHQLCEVIDGSVKSQLTDVLDVDKLIMEQLKSGKLPCEHFGVPLIGNILPWIDSRKIGEQSGEEWKGGVEMNRILGLKKYTIPIDGVCVRVGSLRCHAQALTIKLRRDISIGDIKSMIEESHPWVKVIPNEEHDTLTKLTPAAVAGQLDISVGRLRKLNMGPEYLSAFTVGDQLLWGAAEPIRRMLGRICRGSF